MNTAPVIKELQRRFPGRAIIRIPENDPAEIIVEVRRTSDPNMSVALAVIETSAPHVHRHTHEMYRVERGALHIHIDGAVKLLIPGDTELIRPGQIHWAEGNPAWVCVTCMPAWTAEDHILVDAGR